MTTKVTAADRKSITVDWQMHLVGFEVWKPMWLIRRHGPVVYGVCLEENTVQGIYTPKVFIHCLANPFPTLSINGAAPLPNDSGAAMKVKFRNHASEYLAFIDGLKREHKPLSHLELGISDIFIHFERYLAGEFGTIFPFQQGPYTAMALSAAAIGLVAQAEKVVSQALDSMSAWPERAFNIIGSPQKWADSIRSEIANLDELRSQIESEVDKHGLRKFKDLGLFD